MNSPINTLTLHKPTTTTTQSTNYIPKKEAQKIHSNILNDKKLYEKKTINITYSYINNIKYIIKKEIYILQANV